MLKLFTQNVGLLTEQNRTEQNRSYNYALTKFTFVKGVLRLIERLKPYDCQFDNCKACLLTQ
jgi:hypothetical protein